ncbi:PPOX class F420-dependent oxidoreductase [Patulibacter defluvii]|uniref:PPOX class F420-dependent oxidoreductase n=1 Tax=Patulibacter defluvii TaxID=3095358 RepID=UPI002A75F228|nr:PPOX class F420-dependent oxidoreductase [Patulibacter sp. DM4]
MASSPTTTVVVRRRIDAPAAAVFAAATSVGTYASLAAIRSARVVAPGRGDGDLTDAVRRIDLRALRFDERIEEWRPPQRMAYRIERSWPLPIADQHGTLVVVDRPDGAEVTWTSSFRLAVPLLGRPLTWAARPLTAIGFRVVLARAARLAAAGVAPTARPGRRGALTRRLLKAAKRPMDGARSPRAASVLDQPPRHDPTFAVLDGRTHALLVTYKRDGSAVPTPVWFARDGERVVVWTEVGAFKAKRLRRDPRALLAPCDPRGAPLGPAVAARGRVLTDPAERTRAATVVRRSWNLGQRLFERASRPLTDVHYLELVPAGPEGG